jgi:hypothetical protein
MGARKYRQGVVLDIRDVRLFPRPLTENQAARKSATQVAEKSAGIGQRISAWLFGEKS